MIDMPSSLSAGVKKAANYSHCPLKKRPIKYEIVDDDMHMSMHSDSDHSTTNELSSTIPMDISEPENLSTKPQDLRVKSTHSQKQIPIKPSPISPPPLGLVAGTRGSPTGSISSAYSMSPFGSSPPYSPNSYNNNNNNNLSFGNGKLSGSGPLEPISLNPPAVYLPHHHVPSYLPFNYHPTRNHPHFFPTQYPSFPNTSSSGSPNHHIPPFHHQRIDLVGSSPPHVSPPIKQEPSYPILKSSNDDRNMYNPRLVSPNAENSHPISKVLYSTSSSARDSVISHSSTVVPFPSYSVHHHHHHHRDSMSSGRSSSCDSGISSPTGSSAASVSSIISTNGNASGPSSGGGSSGTRYQCEYCNKSYSTHSGLTKHVQFHCASQNKKSYICKVCDKVYVSMGALKMHIRTHTLPCKCTLCGKAFSRPWLLQGHIRTHTGEKPFACNHCNRAFADRSNLRAHLQTHSEVKKYSCKSCSKTFSRMSLLNKHEDNGCNSSPVHSS